MQDVPNLGGLLRHLGWEGDIFGVHTRREKDKEQLKAVDAWAFDSTPHHELFLVGGMETHIT